MGRHRRSSLKDAVATHAAVSSAAQVVDPNLLHDSDYRKSHARRQIYAMARSGLAARAAVAAELPDDDDEDSETPSNSQPISPSFRRIAGLVKQSARATFMSIRAADGLRETTIGRDVRAKLLQHTKETLVGRNFDKYSVQLEGLREEARMLTQAKRVVLCEVRKTIDVRHTAVNRYQDAVKAAEIGPEEHCTLLMDVMAVSEERAVRAETRLREYHQLLSEANDRHSELMQLLLSDIGEPDTWVKDTLAHLADSTLADLREAFRNNAFDDADAVRECMRLLTDFGANEQELAKLVEAIRTESWREAVELTVAESQALFDKETAQLVAVGIQLDPGELPAGNRARLFWEDHSRSGSDHKLESCAEEEPEEPDAKEDCQAEPAKETAKKTSSVKVPTSSGRRDSTGRGWPEGRGGPDSRGRGLDSQAPGRRKPSKCDGTASTASRGIRPDLAERKEWPMKPGVCGWEKCFIYEQDSSYASDGPGPDFEVRAPERKRQLGKLMRPGTVSRGHPGIDSNSLNPSFILSSCSSTPPMSDGQPELSRDLRSRSGTRDTFDSSPARDAHTCSFPSSRESHRGVGSLPLKNGQLVRGRADRMSSRGALLQQYVGTLGTNTLEAHCQTLLPTSEGIHPRKSVIFSIEEASEVRSALSLPAPRRRANRQGGSSQSIEDTSEAPGIASSRTASRRPRRQAGTPQAGHVDAGDMQSLLLQFGGLKSLAVGRSATLGPVGYVTFNTSQSANAMLAVGEKLALPDGRRFVMANASSSMQPAQSADAPGGLGLAHSEPRQKWQQVPPGGLQGPTPAHGEQKWQQVPPGGLQGPTPAHGEPQPGEQDPHPELLVGRQASPGPRSPEQPSGRQAARPGPREKRPQSSSPATAHEPTQAERVPPKTRERSPRSQADRGPSTSPEAAEVADGPRGRQPGRSTPAREEQPDASPGAQAGPPLPLGAEVLLGRRRSLQPEPLIGLRPALVELQRLVEQRWGSVGGAAAELTSVGGGSLGVAVLTGDLRAGGCPRSCAEVCVLLRALGVPCSETSRLTADEMARLADIEGWYVSEGPVAMRLTGIFKALMLRRMLLDSLRGPERTFAKVHVSTALLGATFGAAGYETALNLEVALDSLYILLHTPGRKATAEMVVSKRGLAILLGVVTSADVALEARVLTVSVLSQAIATHGGPNFADERLAAVLGFSVDAPHAGDVGAGMDRPRENQPPTEVRPAPGTAQAGAAARAQPAGGKETPCEFAVHLANRLWRPLIDTFDPDGPIKGQPLDPMLFHRLLSLLSQARIPATVIGPRVSELSPQITQMLLHLHDNDETDAEMSRILKAFDYLEQSRDEAPDNEGGNGVRALAAGFFGCQVLHDRIVWLESQVAHTRSKFLQQGRHLLQQWDHERKKLFARWPAQWQQKPGELAKYDALAKAVADAEAEGFMTVWAHAEDEAPATPWTPGSQSQSGWWAPRPHGKVTLSTSTTLSSSTAETLAEEVDDASDAPRDGGIDQVILFRLNNRWERSKTTHQKLEVLPLMQRMSSRGSSASLTARLPPVRLPVLASLAVVPQTERGAQRGASRAGRATELMSVDSHVWAPIDKHMRNLRAAERERKEALRRRAIPDATLGPDSPQSWPANGTLQLPPMAGIKPGSHELGSRMRLA